MTFADRSTAASWRFRPGFPVGGEAADGVLQKKPFVDDKSFWRPAVFIACVFVGKVYLEGGKLSDVPLNRLAWTSEDVLSGGQGSASANGGRRNEEADIPARVG